jgi:hypothetical protein
MLKIVAISIALLALWGAEVTDQELQQQKARMDAAEELKLDVQDAIDARSPTATIKPTRALAALLSQEQAYWTRTGVTEAAPLATAALRDATELASAAEAGDLAEITRRYGALLRSCAACHDAHPEARVKAAP